MPDQPPYASYEDRFSAGTVLAAEGARVMLVSCLTCGSTVLLDPRDSESAAYRHHEWHVANAPSEGSS